MASHKDILQLLKEVKAQELPRNKHLRFKLPNGALFCMPVTPSDYRGVNNCMALLKRMLRPTFRQSRTHPCK